ncbi:MAG: hypothetical protein ACHP7N_16195 [Caulobacterales bacterium]
MAVPIRPPVWPPAPTAIQPGRADAQRSAQKAFFEAALAGKVAEPEATPVSPQTAVRTLQATAASGEEPADRIPRPGSIIDIWV